MQQPKNEPNANPIRTLKKSRVISTGSSQRSGLTEGRKEVLQEITEITKVEYRKRKLEIVAPLQFEINLASLLVTLAVEQEQRLTSREKTRRDRLVAATNFPPGSQILLSRNLFRTGHSIIHPNKLFSVTSVTSCSSSFSANLCSIVSGWRPDGRTRLRLIHA